MVQNKIQTTVSGELISRICRYIIPIWMMFLENTGLNQFLDKNDN